MEEKKEENEEESGLEKAQKIVEEMKIENDRREKILEREEKLEAIRMIGGKTKQEKRKKKEEKKHKNMPKKS